MEHICLPESEFSSHVLATYERKMDVLAVLIVVVLSVFKGILIM